MARIRTIKPEFWGDRRLADDLDRNQRLFYVGMWNEADDTGRLQADPRRLLGAIFPYEDDLTPAFVQDTLKTLESTGRAVLYDLNGEPYCQLTKFGGHQRINRPSPSRIPAPPTVHGNGRESSRKPHTPFTEPSSPERNRDVGDGSGKGSGDVKKAAAAASEMPATRAPAPADTREAGPPTSDGSNEFAISQMAEIANAAAQKITTPKERRRFNEAIQAIVLGEDESVWLHPRSRESISWNQRPALLQLATRYFFSGERKDIRRALKLALQRQLDPFPDRTSDSKSKTASTSTSQSPPLHDLQPRPAMLEQFKSESQLIAKWEVDNPDSAESLRKTCVTEVENDPQSAGAGPGMQRAFSQNLYREKVLELVKAASDGTST